MRIAPACAAPSGRENCRGIQPRALPWAITACPFRAALTRACRAWVCGRKSSRPVMRTAHRLCRPFRAGKLSGHPTQGVALGYHSLPFQGCLDSRMPRVGVPSSRSRSCGCPKIVGVPSSRLGCPQFAPLLAQVAQLIALVENRFLQQLSAIIRRAPGRFTEFFSGACPPPKVANGQNSRSNLA